LLFGYIIALVQFKLSYKKCTSFTLIKAYVVITNVQDGLVVYVQMLAQ